MLFKEVSAATYSSIAQGKMKSWSSSCLNSDGGGLSALWKMCLDLVSSIILVSVNAGSFPSSCFRFQCGLLFI